MVFINQVGNNFYSKINILIMNNVLTNDIIADFISRIQHAYKNNKIIVHIPYKELYVKIIEIFYKEGFIRGYKYINDTNNKIIYIVILLKYKNGISAISNIKQFSKKNNRIYFSYKNIKTKYFDNSNYIIYIFSTVKGILTHFDCIKLNIGGELICKII